METSESALHSKPSQLRPLNIIRDLPDVADLVEKCFYDTMDAEGHRYIQQMRRAGHDNAFLRWASTAIETVSMPLSGFVWEENGEVIGNASLIPFRHLKEKYYLIANVAVREEHRRRGIGEALTQAAMAHARQRGAREIWLQVRDDNPTAVNLYLRLGFVEQARRSTWHGRPDRNASIQGSGMTIAKANRREWEEEQAWLRQLYPTNLAWYMSVPWKMFQPGVFPAISRFLLDTESRNWVVRKDGKLAAALAWNPASGGADHLWAAFPPEGCGRALTVLLLHARRTLAWRQNLSLDLPAGSCSDELESAGFHLHRTLLWMRAGETSPADLRTSS